MTPKRIHKGAHHRKANEKLPSEAEQMLGVIVDQNKWFSHILPRADNIPDYAVPSQYALDKFQTPTFPKKVISLFTGAGGLDIGLHRVGFEVAACVDIDKPSWDTISANTNWPVYRESAGNLFNIPTAALLRFAKVKSGEAALVVGGAPCQPFSNMGKKLGTKSHDGRLFREFVRIVDETRPLGFVFENVQGINQSRHQEVFRYFLDVFGRCGYTLSTAVLNAADYGVPQNRKRLFVLGVRGVTKVHIPLVTHASNATLKTLCSDQLLKPNIPRDLMPHVTVGEAFDRIPKSRLSEKDCLVMNVGEKIQERMRLIKPGENFHVLPMHLRPQCWRGGKHQGADTFGRLRRDTPSVTIRTAAYNPTKGRYIHPKEHRGLNTVEMAALQGFPTDWTFKGALVSVGRQIGNAVPPPLAEHIGKIMAAHLVQATDMRADSTTKQRQAARALRADAVTA